MKNSTRNWLNAVEYDTSKKRNFKEPDVMELILKLDCSNQNILCKLMNQIVNSSFNMVVKCVGGYNKGPSFHIQTPKPNLHKYYTYIAIVPGTQKGIDIHSRDKLEGYIKNRGDIELPWKKIIKSDEEIHIIIKYLDHIYKAWLQGNT